MIRADELPWEACTDLVRTRRTAEDTSGFLVADFSKSPLDPDQVRRNVCLTVAAPALNSKLTQLVSAVHDLPAAWTAPGTVLGLALAEAEAAIELANLTSTAPVSEVVQ